MLEKFASMCKIGFVLDFNAFHLTGHRPGTE